jgi:copper/silver efflux system protein
LLTEGVAIIAIFPMFFASGVGGEILAPMALPVLGGLLISDEVVDLFMPVSVKVRRFGRKFPRRLALPVRVMRQTISCHH